jgi:DNA-binding NtrC family response regulator
MNSVNGKSILVVDDDAAMLRALSKVLSGEGAAVNKASRAEEALRYLADKQGRFDLVITDLCMPDLGGTSVLDAVKVAFPEVPVIIITAFGNPELRTQCLRRGAAAFLEKPVDAVALLAGIARVLSSSQNKVELAERGTAEA